MAKPDKKNFNSKEEIDKRLEIVAKTLNDNKEFAVTSLEHARIQTIDAEIASLRKDKEAAKQDPVKSRIAELEKIKESDKVTKESTPVQLNSAKAYVEAHTQHVSNEIDDDLVNSEVKKGEKSTVTHKEYLLRRMKRFATLDIAQEELKVLETFNTIETLTQGEREELGTLTASFEKSHTVQPRKIRYKGLTDAKFFTGNNWDILQTNDQIHNEFLEKKSQFELLMQIKEFDKNKKSLKETAPEQVKACYKMIEEKFNSAASRIEKVGFITMMQELQAKPTPDTVYALAAKHSSFLGQFKKVEENTIVQTPFRQQMITFGKENYGKMISGVSSTTFFGLGLASLLVRVLPIVGIIGLVLGGLGLVGVGAAVYSDNNKKPDNKTVAEPKPQGQAIK